MFGARLPLRDQIHLNNGQLVKWIVHKHSCHIRVGKAYKKSGPTVGAEERGEERAAT